MKALLALASCLLCGPCFAAPLSVYVANYPLKYFAERIGGSHVAVNFPAPKDTDPAFWQPSDEIIATYQKADLILLNGATFSKWAEKTSLPRAKTIDTSAAFKSKFIVIANAVSHSHGPAGTHSHDGTSFTTWIDLQQAIAQAQAVQDAFVKKAPDAKVDFENGFNALKADLEALDARLIVVGQKLAKQPVVASHPVYHYFARRYDLNLKSVLWEPEEVPSAEQMGDLQKILATHKAKWMIWEGEPAKESVQKLSAIGLQSVVFDPCGNTPDSGDFLSVMKANVARMEQVVAK
ncbi:MAG: Zinc transport system substrate-binding protein [Verrucomicrobiaceae bacterium]|nr:Zinc transport system substrate-binding protein [Verrucomicrobiaceae bacterium]